MFDKDSLGELTETIVYVNLLLAILAVIALYDRQRIDDEEDEAEQEHDEAVDHQIGELSRRVGELEETMGVLMLELQSLKK